MHQPGSIFKAVALASSILLVGGYVSYRANAFSWNAGAVPQESPAGNAAASVTLSGGDSTAAMAWDPVIMSGSKSGVGIVISKDLLRPASTNVSLNAPGQASTDPGATTADNSIGGVLITPSVSEMMSSSKSIILAPPPRTVPVANGPVPGKSQSAIRSR